MTATSSIIWEGTPALADKLVAISDLKPFPGNARKGDIAALCASLTRFGQVRAICCTTDKTIVAGHNLTKAARLLGWSHIAVVPAEFETRDEARAYLIADNQTGSLGTYDDPAQISLLEEAAENGGLDGTGFTVDDLEDMKALTKHRQEMVKESELKRHEQNYKEHPEDQLAHLTESLKEHGFYRNIVIANDGTVLAGHGLLAAAREVGLKKVPVTRLPYGPNDPEALKVLAGDNELGKLAEMDDRQLSMMLKEIADGGDMSDLLGTGYDAQTLAALVMVTRPASEIKNMDAAAEWVGLPGFEYAGPRTQLVITFEAEHEGKSATDMRDELCEKLGIAPHYRRAGEGGGNNTWSTWWPPRPREDLKSLKFKDGAEPPEDHDPDDALCMCEICIEAAATKAGIEPTKEEAPAS